MGPYKKSNRSCCDFDRDVWGRRKSVGWSAKGRVGVPGQCNCDSTSLARGEASQWGFVSDGRTPKPFSIQ